MNQRLRDGLVPFACFMAAGFLLFVNTFGQGWTYDDYPVVVRNLDIRSWSAFLRDTYPGRPLRELTYMIDYALFGADPRWYHLQNIVWHGLNGFLLFTLVRSLKGSLWLAWTAGLIFVTHPLTVEVVANTSHRKDTLATAFALLAAVLFLRSYQSRRGWAWLLAALVCGVVACFAKQTGVAIFVVLLAYDLFLAPPQQRKLPLPGKLQALGGLLLLGGLVGWFVWLTGNPTFHALIASALNNLDAAGTSTAIYFAVVLKALAFMVLRLFVPLNLAIEYQIAPPQGFADPWVVAALLLLAGLAVALVVLARRRSPGFLMLVWAIAFWAPVSNLLYPLAYFAADRYLYTPLAGFAVLLGLAAGSAIRAAGPRVVASSVLVGVLAVLSWQQVKVWQSGETLFAQALKVSPNSAKVQEGLASEYINANQLDKALELLNQAHTSGKGGKALYLLGLVYEKKGEIDLAIKHYRLFVLRNDPRYQKEVFGVRNVLRMKYRIQM